MENQMVEDNSSIMEANGKWCNDGPILLGDIGKQNEALDVGLLADLDSYWEDINGRLTISRMVSESVIKGMVSAVTQEAAETIAQKELEVAELKERLNLYQVGMDKNDSLGSKVVQHKFDSLGTGVSCSYTDALAKQDKLSESLTSLKSVAMEQFKKLEKEIDKVRDCRASRKINSDSLDSGPVSVEKVSKNGMNVDDTLASLRNTLDTVYKKVDDMMYLSKTSLNEWLFKHDLREGMEDTVMKKPLHSVREDIEGLGDKQASFYSSGNVIWKEKIKEITKLRQELDAISKSFFVHETGQLTSHGSLELGEDWNTTKLTDNFRRNVSGNHISTSTSLWEGNGKLDESIIAPESWGVAQLNHMSKEELANHFKSEMTKMKRNFESREEIITDKYFSLRREYLKIKGSSLPSRKDTEFDLLRKKIPEVILKLDDILVESEKIPTLSKNADSLIGLKERFDLLVIQNHQLKDLLRDNKKEVETIALQVSGAEQKNSQNLPAEEKLVKLIVDLKCEIEDMHVHHSICEKVNECFIREVTWQIRSIAEESHCVQETNNVASTQAAQNVDSAYKNETEDSVMELSIMQGLLEVFLVEFLEEANEKLELSKIRYTEENKLRVLLEMQAMETEKTLNLGIAEKERLDQKILLMAALLEEKEKSVLQAEEGLAKANEQFELASQELNNLREQANKQRIVFLESGKVSDIMKGDLAKALEKIELQKLEICQLNQKLEQIDEERKMLHATVQEKDDLLSLTVVKERENKKQLESIPILEKGCSKLVTDFEYRVSEVIKINSLRLESVSSQLNDAIQNAILARRTGLMYKLKLEKRHSDLQKAEAEVDLLGDEVDVLLSLLEKIYIALDHYSPVLKHYPGIMEILKMVRKELSGGSTRFKAA